MEISATGVRCSCKSGAINRKVRAIKGLRDTRLWPRRIVFDHFRALLDISDPSIFRYRFYADRSNIISTLHIFDT